MSVTPGASSHWWSSKWVMAGREAAVVERAECLQPNVLGYTWDGKQYQVDVPQGQYENLTRLLEAGDYKTLNALAHEA